MIMGQVQVFRAEGDSLERLPVEASSFDEATLKTGHGVYSVFRLYEGGKVLRLDRHLARMRRSAGKLPMGYPHSDDWFRAMVRRAVEASGIEIPRVRITVPYGAPQTAIISLEPHSPDPDEVYRQGIAVGLANVHRERPEIKDSRFIEKRADLRAEQSDVFEIVLVDDLGRLLEGTRTNFFAIYNGELRTAGDGVLEGIGRGIVLNIAPEILPVKQEAIRVDDLPHIEEAMLSSASRGIIPIVRIGGVTIGDGTPGPLTARLRERFIAQEEAELEPL
jgi:branched-chain amino acid aminotransferase